MAVHHDGYTITCDGTACNEKYESTSTCHRGAVRDARRAGWFVGVIRVTKVLPRSRVRSVNRTLCVACRWFVEAT